VEPRSALLEEPPLVPLASLIPLAEERLWSLEVVGPWEYVKDASIESSGPPVWVASLKYVVNKDLRPSRADSFFFELDIGLWGRGGEDLFKDVIR